MMNEPSALKPSSAKLWYNCPQSSARIFGSKLGPANDFGHVLGWNDEFEVKTFAFG